MEILILIIALALIFDYINGFHDAANSIATIVSTKVLTPFQAVIWAACFNFVAFFIAKCIIGGFGIANTVSKTVVEDYITLPIILAGVIAAIVWNLFTWWKGIPSSSSHTLIGGFAYIKFIRPKQASKASADPDDYDFADEEEYINEDEPEPEEETEDTK